MENKVVKTMIGAVALSSAAIAGPVAGPIETVAAPSCGNFCESLKTVGKLYKNSDNPYIQEVSFFGRMQYQTAYHTGENFAGADNSGTHSELRRLRAGLKVKAFNALELKANVNLETGGDKNTRLGYNSFDVATATYNFGTLGAVENFKLSFGRHKHTFTAEAHTSSKKIKTIERSNISNLFYGSLRPTGFLASGEVNGVKAKLGVYSTSAYGGNRNSFVDGFNDGYAYYLNLQHKGFNFDFIKTDVSATDDNLFNQDWAASLAYSTEIATWDTMANAVYGKLSNGDSAYGLVLMASKFIVEDKVEFVSRYQYAGSSGDNLRLTSRYARSVEGGRGDSNHSLYAGLNYYFCGNNSKIQTGIEYETLDNEAGQSADATTLWAAYRMYF